MIGMQMSIINDEAGIKKRNAAWGLSCPIRFIRKSAVSEIKRMRRVMPQSSKGLYTYSLVEMWIKAS